MQNHQHIIVRSVDKTKARAWTNKSEDSPSSQSSFWKDNVDGSDPSIHSAKYDIMCESSTGDHACHLVELGKSLDILAEAIHPFDTEHELLCHSSGNRARHGVEKRSEATLQVARWNLIKGITSSDRSSACQVASESRRLTRSSN
ncbi:hypothetical protein M752DRAFT_264169 [Aspergillus phoenicis ATCC 13157]|uniref:Uncharacterized protein n=1 Tax=Aspergillus phoenicis ATCC 13157 TaxID=1353007 RepID=A0A370PPY2_ASPPH|nr:hypothetical protein M752DRAFT_264169 [Aspergillus phoenicis ATCC 13157]